MTETTEERRAKKKKIVLIVLQGIVMGVMTTLELRARKGNK